MTDENTNATGTENSATPTTTTTEPSTTETPSSTTEAPAGDDDKLDLASGTTKEGADEANGKAPDGAAGDGDGDADGDDDPTAAFYGAPDEAEGYKLEGLPEGTVLDEEAVKLISPALRELNLSNDGASKLVSTYAETVLPRVAQQVQDGIQEQVLATRKDWEVEARSFIAGKDAEGNELVLKSGTGKPLSFDGLSVKQVQQNAARALDRIAPEGFRGFLEETGLGQHPAMIAFAYQAGKLLAEDTDVTGDTRSGGPKPKPAGGRPMADADKFYS